MTDQNIVKVILAGGVGSRLWPLSRKAFPKQFHTLFGSEPMMGATLQRLNGLCNSHPVVVGNEEHRFLIADALKDAGHDSASVILEPEPKNTAAAIALAALEIAETDPDARMLVLPADHWIEDDGPLAEALSAAMEHLTLDDLVAFGIQPARPETGYGYIELDGDGSAPVRPMKQFVEKPDRATAEKYLESGRFLWNSGMFLFPAQKIVDELQAHAPDIMAAVKRSFDGRKTDGIFVRPDAAAFAEARADSIDYAIMEKTASARVIPVNIQWSDIGSWQSYLERGQAGQACDERGNVCDGDTLAVDCDNSLLVSRKRLVSAVGLKDVAVIETGDAVLVMPVSEAQNVKHLLGALNEQGRDEADTHAKVHRPWGTYETVDDGERYQVKRITVKPGGRLSLQMHHHRAEHWIIVSGTARVTRGEESFILTENQSTYIPLGEKHRIENPGAIPLEFIEVQSGAYLGEDDIVRFEDTYGRA
ncbi:mannose-1-phosphate guanylyltransferase/mannose-6-phosphate isomerase [Natronospira bacteriovora]|uniref:mannose-1-phosphate guanylyltransferase n=1 Tax=Natronospira bacteriovora TaxID=3069753 RepID=A0ABU0W8S7_9GAMM|nr:mannose-1-phosphate guanylyltransferase/mannose-6-phosphate isomerase [Natronospira sp. AB-CW4]MDQ2070153.1 mannose-1-phosphate guanylyltransferase/mannose-6-phosphate isomerase [Natronospira sp. AB-CW4]